MYLPTRETIAAFQDNCSTVELGTKSSNEAVLEPLLHNEATIRYNQAHKASIANKPQQRRT